MRVILETSWDVVYLSGFFSFVIYFQYAIFTTIMYTYMTKSNNETTPTMFGITVTLHGIGQCIGALGAAYWTKRKYRTKKPLVVGFIVGLLSNIIFMIVDQVPKSFVITLFMINRFFGGFAMGNTATLRTALTAHSRPDERAKAMSIFIGGRGLGLVLGPGLQLMFLFLGEDGFQLFDGFWIHSNNAAGLVSLVLNSTAILGLLLLFNEVESNGGFGSTRSMESHENYPDPDPIAMFICMLTRYGQNFTFYAIETLAPAFIMMMFNVERTEAVRSTAICFFSAGIVAIFIYLSFVTTDIANRINIGKSNTISLLVFIGYLISTYQWPFLKENVEQNTGQLQGGCDFENNSWCHGLTKTPQIAFYIGYIITFGGCTPFINVSDATLYSKLFNPVGQAIEQSLYDVSQIFARVVAPFVCTIIYSYFGPRRVWELLFVQLVVITIFWIGFAKRMVPLRAKPRPVFYLE